VPTLFIAGAGCSRGTLECVRSSPPVARQFVNELERRGWTGEYPELARVIEHARKAYGHVGLEELWTCIDLTRSSLGRFLSRGLLEDQWSVS
jgi:hypothetical protein